MIAEEPVWIEGVAAELRAVLHVLMVNAVEASPMGARVQVYVETCETGVQVRVQDQGPGLDPPIRERLFTPHTSSKPQGAGMGLYLAQRIVTNRYGGKVELLDLAGGGLEARLCLQARSGQA